MSDQPARSGPECAADSQQRRERRPRRKPPFWEWVVAACGLILVAGTLGFLLYQAIAGPEQPPQVRVHVDGVQPGGSGYLVLFVVTNSGSETAAGLTVEGELLRSGVAVEESSVTLDYVPAHSQRHGGLFFAEDPASFEIKLRALGYMEP